MSAADSAAGRRLPLSRGHVEVSPSGAVLVRGAEDRTPTPDDGVGADLVRAALGREAVHAGAPERFLPVDMTNWNVVVDERFLVKVPRVVGGCDRAARQLGRLAGTDLTPPLLGTVTLGGTLVALVTAFVPDTQDGWDWAADDVAAWLRGGARRGGAPTWPATLGALTGRLHRALLAGAAPGRPAGPARSLDARRAHAHGLLRRLVDGYPDVAVRERVARRARTLAAAIDSLPPTTAAPAFELHGDLHVGQVLRRTADADADDTDSTDIGAAARYLVIDLDGDPQDPHGADLDGAARDVAHLLVSLDLVAAVACRRLGRPDDRATAWASSAQDALLAAYRAVAGDLLDEALLPGLRAEQVLLELTYAWDHLPRWAYAPELALVTRYPLDAAHAPAPTPRTAPDHRPTDEEPPWTPPPSDATSS